MAEIELKKRVVYAGDVHIALLKAGWSIREACDFVNGLPKADVAEVRHGHWIDASIKGVSHYRCTWCGEYIESVWTANFDYHYCPNCGARMDGGADNGEWNTV